VQKKVFAFRYALVFLLIITAGTMAFAKGKQDAKKDTAAPEETLQDAVLLDDAIKAAAQHIIEELNPGTVVAVLNFASESEALSNYVIEEMGGMLINGKKITVVDRQRLEIIRQEENFQMSGEVSDESAQSIGKKLGAQSVVTGSFSKLGDTAYRFRVQTLNVETAAMEASSSVDVRNDRRLRQIAVGLQSSTAPPQRPVIDGFVWIPGGTFMMGSPASEADRDDDEVQHRVTVSAFYMGQYEVSQKEYTEVMGNNPSNFKDPNLPVEQVTWFDAVRYCNARSLKEGLALAYTINGEKVTWNRNANGFRLPTEAEWEYACRAGTTGPFSTGNNITTGQANYNGKYPYNNNIKGTYRERAIEVWSFASNPWGVYNMHGNVWEWCWDWYGGYSMADQTDPAGAVSGATRVLRGGGWNDNAQSLRSARRGDNEPSGRNDSDGFRVVRP
jgi:formylglycine-generating enzyme required for sulfatase activity